jgi:hypothetical protein
MRSFTGTVLVASWAALLLASTTPARATPESLGSVHVGVSGGYGWLSKDLDLSGGAASRRQWDRGPSAA